MTKKLMTLLIILILVTIVACTVPTPDSGAPQTTAAEEVSVSEDIDEVTSVEEDLDTSSMDSLDQDLADITW